MTDRPILFSAPMVNALLREAREPGTGKTQTRRLISPQPHAWEARVADIAEPTFDEEYQQWGQWETIWNRCSAMWEPEEDIFVPLKLRYAVGDRLYVREEWKSTPAYDDQAPSDMGGDNPVFYTADGATFSWAEADGSRQGRRRAGMHMPRWASRLTLIVEAVRVERLQSISEEDARAEGIEVGIHPITGEECGWKDYSIIHGGPHKGKRHPHAIAPWKTAQLSYQSLWEALHGPNGWVANPWVVAVTFRVLASNIDQVPA